MIDDGDIYWADKRNIDDLNQTREEESFELTEELKEELFKIQSKCYENEKV